MCVCPNKVQHHVHVVCHCLLLQGVTMATAKTARVKFEYMKCCVLKHKGPLCLLILKPFYPKESNFYFLARVMHSQTNLDLSPEGGHQSSHHPHHRIILVGQLCQPCRLSHSENKLTAPSSGQDEGRNPKQLEI